MSRPRASCGSFAGNCGLVAMTGDDGEHCQATASGRTGMFPEHCPPLVAQYSLPSRRSRNAAGVSSGVAETRQCLLQASAGFVVLLRASAEFVAKPHAHDGNDLMADFTPTQGRYLAYIHAYTNLHGYPPAESEIAAAHLRVAAIGEPDGEDTGEEWADPAPAGTASFDPGPGPRGRDSAVERPQAREDSGVRDKRSSPVATAPAAPPSSLYVVSVFLVGGPTSEKFANKEISRVIEIRGDQTLEQLHHAIFKAYDRCDNHMYQFQFGKRPFDPNGPNYGVPSPHQGSKDDGDARATTIDDLDLKEGRAFGYWFDFGDDWYHQVHVDRIEKAIPTVTYPRVIRRVGKSPPQYCDE